jgi:hypothetical protein
VADVHVAGPEASGPSRLAQSGRGDGRERRVEPKVDGNVGPRALAIYRLRTTNAPTAAIPTMTRAKTIAVVGPAVCPAGVG